MARHSEVTYIRPKTKKEWASSKKLALINTALLLLIALKVFKVL